MPDTARNITLSVLNALSQNKGLTLDAILENHEPELALLSKRDRAFFNALVFGVTRFRNHLDHVIRFISTTPLAKIDPIVLNVIRIGIFQMKFMDRVPESAAVNTSVNLIKNAKLPAWIVKFTNGVLRNAARKINEIPFPEKNSKPESYLSLYHSFPEWLIRKWIGRYGVSTTESLCKSLNEIPATTIRVNTLKTSRDFFLNRLHQEGFEANPTLFSPDGVTIRSGYDAVTGFPGYEEGLFQVQDEAAQLVTLLLDPRPGEHILDACAGLGGKTAHMAQLMNDQGMIIAVDRDIRRLRKLKQETHRLGIQSIKVACMDMESGFTAKPEWLFDKVLVDAPCSGLGVIRRNPDIKWQAHKENLEPYKTKQIQLLEAVTPLVKPGGVIVYAVCSTEPEENEEVIQNFKKYNPSFEIEAPFKNWGTSPLSSLIHKEGYLMTMPSPSLMDGFFAVRLRRTDSFT